MSAKMEGCRVARYHATVKGRLQHLMCGVRQRCKQSNIECDIDRDYLLEVYEEQNGRCVLSGKEFDLRSRIGGRTYASPWGLSIDKVDPHQGYVKGNVRLICTMANVCKGRWSDTEVMEFCQSVMENKV